MPSPVRHKQFCSPTRKLRRLIPRAAAAQLALLMVATIASGAGPIPVSNSSSLKSAQPPAASINDRPHGVELLLAAEWNGPIRDVEFFLFGSDAKPLWAGSQRSAGLSSYIYCVVPRDVSRRIAKVIVRDSTEATQAERQKIQTEALGELGWPQHIAKAVIEAAAVIGMTKEQAGVSWGRPR